MPNTRMALTVALGLHVVWVLVTYLLEGRIQAFLRPEAMGARLFYALVANILIGIGGLALVIRFLLRAGTISTEQAGFRGFGHAAFAIIVGVVLGLAFYALQGGSVLEPDSSHQCLRPGARDLYSGDSGVLGRGRERLSSFAAGSR